MRKISTLARAVLVLVIAISFLYSGKARAQDAKPVQFGLNMGLNLSKIVWTDSWMTEFKDSGRLTQPSMRYGGQVEFAVRSGIGVVTGVGYRMTGEKYGGIREDGSEWWMKRMGSYLTVPVLLKYRAGTVLGLRPIIEFGPQAGILLSFYGMGDATGMRVEMMQNVKRAVLELRGGTGFEFPMGGMYTGVAEVGYEYGLTSFVKKEVQMPAKSRNLSFSMGVRF